MYAWHAIEEVEHKGVAYDVMIDYAKVGYFKRIGALIHSTFMFPYVILKFTNAMLKADGFGLLQRAKLFAKGIWWLLKPGGFVAPAAQALRAVLQARLPPLAGNRAARLRRVAARLRQAPRSRWKPANSCAPTWPRLGEGLPRIFLRDTPLSWLDFGTPVSGVPISFMRIPLPPAGRAGGLGHQAHPAVHAFRLDQGGRQVRFQRPAPSSKRQASRST